MLTLIVAVANNNAIGYKNDLLIRLSDDLKRFKALTMGHHILMGRNTYDSIGHPLPGRTIVVVTSRDDLKPEPGLKIAHDMSEAIRLTPFAEGEEIMVAGGAKMYEETMPFAEKIYLTRIHKDFEADTFFPEIREDLWRIAEESPIMKSPEGVRYQYIQYDRYN